MKFCKFNLNVWQNCDCPFNGSSQLQTSKIHFFVNHKWHKKCCIQSAVVTVQLKFCDLISSEANFL